MTWQKWTNWAGWTVGQYEAWKVMRAEIYKTGETSEQLVQ